jgi:hypothetical protein
MGKLKSVVEDFLSEGGYDLGYNMDAIPHLDDMRIILRNSILVWHYYGFENAAEYYRECEINSIQRGDYDG